jgi:CheY-like chemotaxis protein
MDVMMPVMDGLTATREIRRNPDWQNLPVIALTAKAMPDDQQRCIDAGANDYMAKPLDVEKLLSLVRVWMPR